MADASELVVSDDPREQKRREIRIASKYRHDFAWRLAWQGMAVLAAWVASIVLTMQGSLPYWAAVLINGWLVFACYMTLHEATHGNICGDHARWRWFEDLLGSLAAIPMWFSYRAHRISHMKHHAHTNDPRRDPDHFVGGPFRAVLPKYALLSFMQLAVPVLSLFPRGLELLPRPLRSSEVSAELMTPEEGRISRRFTLACLAVFAALSLAGFFKEAFLLWYLPSRIGFFIVVVVFAWLPHHPHDERGRYRDTRITLFPGSTFLIRGQDHHLLHHMFPRVPHYRLPALFREMRPILEAQGARIEGPLAGPDAPPIRLRWDAERGSA